MERLITEQKSGGRRERGARDRKLRWGVLFPVLLLLGMATSCGRTALPEDYRQRGFRAELTWQTGSLTLSAVAEAEPLRTGEERTVTLSMTAPASLAGIVLTQRGEERRVSCGGMETDGAALTGLLRVTELLLPEGARRLTGGGETDGRDVVFAEVYGTEEAKGTGEYEDGNEDGNKEEKKKGNEEIYELVLEKESGAPLRVGCGEERVEITAFTWLP